MFRVKRGDQGTDRPTCDSLLKIQSTCTKNGLPFVIGFRPLAMENRPLETIRN